jgi:uncharacterized protein
VNEPKEKDVMNGKVSNETLEKLARLKQRIGAFKSAVIAFSGGVDSTFLARVSRDVLGERALLVTAKRPRDLPKCWG